MKILPLSCRCTDESIYLEKWRLVRYCVAKPVRVHEQSCCIAHSPLGH